MKLLLINPKFPESFWSFKWAADNVLPHRKTVNPPLGLATLAALCPQWWEVEIIDENIESIHFKPQADIIGICGMGVQFERQQELLTFYKSKGYFVVAGGSNASLCPELYESLADTIISGEAEYIWKEFCNDFINGKPKRLYRETGTVDLTDSPVPRFDLLQLDRYMSVSLQFSRGCPFRCEFCDIIVMFGRKPRTKTLEQVGNELDLLMELKANKVFFVDDNLIGNKRMAKGLMKFLKDYQLKHQYRFNFGTEVSLNLAQDDELLELFKQANFDWVFVGIESPDEECLKETKKFQNLHQDILSSVRKIYSSGLQIFGGFIIGFDNDTAKTFNTQYHFITKSGIQAAMIGLLTALPKTPLHARLAKEGRLIPKANNSDNTKLGTNIIPKQMSYNHMVSGYQALHHRLLTHRNIAGRIKNKIRYLKNPNYHGGYSFKEYVSIFRKFVMRGLIASGFSCTFHFLRTIPLLKLRLFPIVLQDWIVGLSMRDYVERHFIGDFETVNQVSHKHFKLLEETFHHYLQHEKLEVSFNQVKNAAANLSISLKGLLDGDFFKLAARHMEKILTNTTSSITLNIEEFHEVQILNLDRLLKRLSRYGDRIHITLNDKLRDIIVIDSSVFHLEMKI